MEIDQSVISDLSHGKNAAFEILFKTFYPKIHRFAMMLLKNADDTDDVCQLVFMKLWLRREHLVMVADLDAYIFILAKHTIIDYLSANKINTIPIEHTSLDTYDEQTPHNLMVANDTKLLIDMIVENMPNQRKTVYRMSREKHMKSEDIAKALGLTKKTVENHLNLALKDIKKALHFILAFAFWV